MNDCVQLGQPFHKYSFGIYLYNANPENMEC